jgi:hypothetical protein
VPAPPCAVDFRTLNWHARYWHNDADFTTCLPTAQPQGRRDDPAEKLLVYRRGAWLGATMA